MDDNIKLFFMEPGASEYQVEYNPNICFWFEHIQEEHKLASGLTRFYHKGYKFYANLSWQNPVFFRGEQYDRFRKIYNLNAGLTLCPAPESLPGACYGVQWINDFDFHLVAGMTPFGYEGSMVLEGTSIFTSIDSEIVMEN